MVPGGAANARAARTVEMQTAAVIQCFPMSCLQSDDFDDQIKCCLPVTMLFYPDHPAFHLTGGNQPQPFAVAAVGLVITQDKQEAGRNDPVTPFKLPDSLMPAILVKRAGILTGEMESPNTV